MFDFQQMQTKINTKILQVKKLYVDVSHIIEFCYVLKQTTN